MRLGYFTVSALLGLGWFPVLLVPSWTRRWLIEDRRMISGNMALLVVTSVTVAWLFRGYIERTTTFMDHLWRGFVLPYVGCVIYLTLWNALSWIRSLIFGDRINVHEALILYPWGLSYALMACFVVIPYGVFCQHVMREALDKEWLRADQAR